jgi:hypothetical protein
MGIGKTAVLRHTRDIKVRLPHSPVHISPSARKITLEKALVITDLIFEEWVRKKKRRWYAGMEASDYALVDSFSKNLSKVYGLPYKKPRRTKDGTFYVEYYSKEMVKDLLRYTPSYSTTDPTCRIPDEIMNAPREWKREILRRAFGEEAGPVFYSYIWRDGYKRYKRSISFGSYSQDVRSKAMKMLAEFGIKSYEEGYAIRIYGRENLEKFAREIGFLPRVKVVRGKYWLGHEKQEVLEKMLESYRSWR